MDLPKDLISHPGEVLKDVLEGLNLSPDELSKKSNITISDIALILVGMKDIDLEIAKKLERSIGISAELLLSLQKDYNKFKC